MDRRALTSQTTKTGLADIGVQASAARVRATPISLDHISEKGRTLFIAIGDVMPALPGVAYLNEETFNLATLRMQLQPVFHCSSLNALDPGSGR